MKFAHLPFKRRAVVTALSLSALVLLSSCARQPKRVQVYQAQMGTSVVGDMRSQLRTGEEVQVRQAGNYVDADGTYHEAHRTFRLVKDSAWNLGFSDPAGRRIVPSRASERSVPRPISEVSPAGAMAARGAEKPGSAPKVAKVDQNELKMLQSLKSLEARLSEQGVIVNRLIQRSGSAESLLSQIRNQLQDRTTTDNLQARISELESKLALARKESDNAKVEEPSVPVALVWKSLNNDG